MPKAIIEVIDTEPGKFQVLIRYEGPNGFDPESDAHQHANNIMTRFDAEVDPTGPRMHWSPEQLAAYDMVTKMGGTPEQAMEAAGPGIAGAPDGLEEPEAEPPSLILGPNA